MFDHPYGNKLFLTSSLNFPWQGFVCIDTSIHVRANKIKQSCEQCSEMHCPVYIIYQRPSVFARVIPLFLSFLLIGPLLLDGQRTWTDPVIFKLCFISGLSVLPNRTKILEYSLRLWPAADPLSVSGCRTAEKLGRRPPTDPSSPCYTTTTQHLFLSKLCAAAEDTNPISLSSAELAQLWPAGILPPC